MKILTGILFTCLVIIGNAQQQEKFNNLNNYISFRLKNDRYSGITTMYQSDSILFQHIGGIANRSWDIPITSRTRFDLASVTKMFTATAVGILIDRDQIKLTKTIGEYLPEFPITEIAQNVTIKELLSHTSGISDFFFESEYLLSDRNRLRKLSDYDRFFKTLRRGTVPEDQIAYSNAGYVILGRIIERITGVSYYEFCKKEIFMKAGMDGTDFYENDIPVRELAEGYYLNDPQVTTEFGVPNDGRIRKNTPLRAVKGMPAGGAYSTSKDLSKFLNKLNGTLLSTPTFQLMTTAVRAGYGMGFQTYDYNGIKVIGHSGGFYGASTMAFLLPEKNQVFISLTNNSFGAQPVFDRYINLLNNEISYTPISLPEDKINSFEGYYEVYEGDMKGRQISIKASGVKLVFDESFQLEFFPIGTNKFVDIDNDFFTLEFTMNNGKVEGFNRTDNREFVQKAKKIDASAIKTIQALQIEDEVLKQYLGSYQFDDSGMMAGHKPTFEVKDGALYIDNALKFLPYEYDKFFMENDPGMKLHFQRSDNDQLVGIHVLREDQIVGKVKKLN